MSADFLNAAALEVLRRYSPLLWSGMPRPLGNHGGFSGARLWGLDGGAGPLCLRAWPVGYTSERLSFVHFHISAARDGRLSFVPRVFTTPDGMSHVEYGGRLWELQEWLPGEADYHRRPSVMKLRAACTALARLHACWPPSNRSGAGLYPAVQRRLDALREWRSLVTTGWRPFPQAGIEDSARQLAERAWRALAAHIDAVPERLKHWTRRTGPLQPCLCDIWHDHILFTDESVTGVVDYGAMKVDHAAVDVARLLGSLVEDDAEGWAKGLAAYREVLPFSSEDERLARDLDATGTVVATATWLRWLYHDGKDLADRALALRRLEAIVRRMEKVHEPEAPLG